MRMPRCCAFAPCAPLTPGITQILVNIFVKKSFSQYFYVLLTKTERMDALLASRFCTSTVGLVASDN